jgi:hypothetical protein
MRRQYVLGMCISIVFSTLNQAVALDKLHSRQFDLKYEADTVPLSDGWSKGSSGSPVESVSNGWFHFESSVPDICHYKKTSWEVETNENFTLEIRYKTPTQGQITFSIDDGVKRHLLRLTTNSVQWISSSITNIASCAPDTTYTCRLASWLHQNERYVQIWHDGTTVLGPTTDVGWSLVGKEFFWGDDQVDDAIAIDIDYLRMDHSGAYEPDLPQLSIWTAVEIGWNSNTNVTYQVQTTTNLVDGPWTNLGNSVQGNGSTNVTFDSIRGMAKKFYRVIEENP